MQLLQEVWISFKSTVRGFDSPHQLALGLTAGVFIGLIPPTSLLPYLLVVLAILTPGNLLCLGVGIVAGAWISPALDGMHHALGAWLLNQDVASSAIASVAAWPLVPWLKLNNTVVIGSLMSGMLAAVPAYLLSRQLVVWLAAPIYRLITENRLARRWWPRSELSQLQES